MNDDRKGGGDDRKYDRENAAKGAWELAENHEGNNGILATKQGDGRGFEVWTDNYGNETILESLFREDWSRNGP